MLAGGSLIRCIARTRLVIGIRYYSVISRSHHRHKTEHVDHPISSTLSHYSISIQCTVMAFLNQLKEQLLKENNLLGDQIRTLVGKLEETKTNPNTKLTDEMIIKPATSLAETEAEEALKKLSVSGEKPALKEEGTPKAAEACQPKRAKETNKGGKAPVEDKPIDIGRLDLRIGQIVDVKRHPDADSLYVETIICGDESPRTVISGLVKHVPIEEMKDKKVVVLCNLKPAKMRGILSEAMVMCASTPEKVELITPPESSSPGDRVVFEGYEALPDIQLNPKKKIWEQVSVDVKTNEDGTAVYKDVPFQIAGKPGLFKSNLKNTPIK